MNAGGGRGRSPRRGTASDGISGYVVVNLGLVLVWCLAGDGFPWPVIPLVFWGTGLASHYVGAHRTPDRAWIDRETERILSEQGGGRG